MMMMKAYNPKLLRANISANASAAKASRAANVPCRAHVPLGAAKLVFRRAQHHPRCRPSLAVRARAAPSLGDDSDAMARYKVYRSPAPASEATPSSPAPSAPPPPPSSPRAVKVRVVGTGQKGCAALDSLIRTRILPQGAFYAVNTDPKALEGVTGAVRLLVNPQGGMEDPAAALTDVAEAEVQARVLGGGDSDPPPFFIISAAGGDAGGRIAVGAARAARAAGSFTSAVAVLPFQFEGAKKLKEAAEVVAELRGGNVDLMLVVDQSVLLNQPGMTVENAGIIADSAMLRGVRAVASALASPAALFSPRGGEEAAWDELAAPSRARAAMSGGAKAAVGHGAAEVFGSRRAAAASDAVDAATQSAFLGGLASAPGVIAVVTTPPGEGAREVVEAAASQLRKKVGGDAWVAAFGSSSGEEGVVEVTLLSWAGEEAAAPAPAAPAARAAAAPPAAVEYPAAEEEVGEGGVAEATRSRILREQLGADDDDVAAAAAAAAGAGEGEDGGESKRWKMAAALAGGGVSVDRAPVEDNGLETFEWKDDFVPGEDNDGGGAWGEPWELDEDEDEDAASQAGGVEGGGGMLPGPLADLRKMWRRSKGPRTVRERISGVLASDRSARVEVGEVALPVVEMKYPDGAFYEGQWGAGLPEGKGRRVDANGCWYEGQWKGGKKHGWGVAFTYGDRYEGQWRDGFQHGKGTLTFSGGDRLEGTFEGGEAEGPGVTRFANGDTFYGRYKQGRMHGQGLLVERGGVQWEETWENGKRAAVRKLEEGLPLPDAN